MIKQFITWQIALSKLPLRKSLETASRISLQILLEKYSLARSTNIRVCSMNNIQNFLGNSRRVPRVTETYGNIPFQIFYFLYINSVFVVFIYHYLFRIQREKRENKTFSLKGYYLSIYFTNKYVQKRVHYWLAAIQKRIHTLHNYQAIKNHVTDKHDCRQWTRRIRRIQRIRRIYHIINCRRLWYYATTEEFSQKQMWP